MYSDASASHPSSGGGARCVCVRRSLVILTAVLVLAAVATSTAAAHEEVVKVSQRTLLSSLLVPHAGKFAITAPAGVEDRISARTTPEDDPMHFVKCQNGALVDGLECICPIYYMGEDCSGRQCPNSIGGDGPYRILPVNEGTKMCDRCDRDDFDGLNCHLCQRDSACGVHAGPNAKCNRQLKIRGDNKQYQCRLQSEAFVKLIGDGRDVIPEIMLNCTTMDGSAFMSGSNGKCSMAIYRIEERGEYVDPFFRCDASKCSMKETRAEHQAVVKESLGQRILFVVRTCGQVAMVTLCAFIALLGAFTHALGHRRLTRLTAVLATALCAVTGLYLIIVMVGMSPTAVETVVVVECKKTTCACAEDPPKHYKPICSESPALVQILRTVVNGLRIDCIAGTGACKLMLEDMAAIFDANCTGSECVDEERFPEKPHEEESRSSSGSGDGSSGSYWNRKHIMQLLVAGVVVSLVGVVVHWFHLRGRSAERAKEFLVIFNVATGNEPDDMDGSGAPGSGHAAAAAAARRRSETHNGVEHAESEAAAVNGGEDRGECGERVRLLGVSASQSSLDATEGGGAVHDSRHAVRASVMRRASRLTHEEQVSVTNVRRLTRSVLELSVENLRYALAGSCLADQEDSDSRVILSNINFAVRSGEVLALMGPSGAGKTTLLDLLSARAKSGTTSGRVVLNGTPIQTTGSRARKYRNIIGYVSQEDTLLPALTVRQTIEYAARLKLPSAFSDRTIRRIVNRMISALKLSRCEHTRIGNAEGLRGISGGEKRRVSIAVELLANPRILFLDEPTSGLDAVSARRVVEAVVELAKNSPMQLYAPHYFAFRPIVIFSIHQPSIEIYELFDQILLLSKGVSVYCGRARDAAAVLERRVTDAFGGTRTVPHRSAQANPAEYLMNLEEVLDDSVRAELQEEDVRERAERLELQRRRESLTPTRQPTGGSQVAEITVTGEELLNTTATYRIYYANVYEQIALLTSRAVTSLIGSFHLVVCHALVVACLASLMSFLYQQQALDLPGALNRVGSCSFVLLVTSFVSLSCLEQLILERKLFVVERENGFYSTFPYLVSKIVVDILPLRVLPAVVLSAVIYFPMGFRVDSGFHFFYFVFVIVLFSVCMTLLVMCIGIVTGTFGAAALLSSVVILWNFVFGGALVQSETIPALLQPFKNGSPFFLAFESLMVNELYGQDCIFSPTDATGKETAAKIPILCVQYLANVGLKPARASSDVMQLGLYCFGLTGLAWVLLAVCTRLIR